MYLIEDDSVHLLVIIAVSQESKNLYCSIWMLNSTSQNFHAELQLPCKVSLFLDTEFQLCSVFGLASLNFI